MSILARNAQGGFQKTDASAVPLGSMEGAGRENPYSQNFKVPDWLIAKPTPFMLTRYLIQANHLHHNDLSVTGAGLGMAKRLLAQYPLDLIARTIWHLGRTHRNMFDFKLVVHVLRQETRE